MIETHDVVLRPEFTHQRHTESPARAENYNFHLFRALMREQSFGE
jgi:hypothetical protein